MIFSKEDLKHGRTLKRILDRFINLSGYRVNARKTNMFFYGEVDEALSNLLSNLLGFQKVHDLGTYLGIPLFHKRVTTSTLRFVVDKVLNKLSNWDAKKLSLASKVIFA